MLRSKQRRPLAHAIVALLFVLNATTQAARAEDAHFALDLAVAAPANTQDPFHVHVTETLVAAKPGVNVTITYKVLVIDPDNEQSVLLGPVTDRNSVGGGHGESRIDYWPRRNGEFTFRLIRVDGDVETVIAERRVATDKAVALALSSPPGTRPDGQFAITGIRAIPEQPTVGQPVTIEVDAINSSMQPVSQTVPVVLSDDTGDRTLAIGTFTLDAGLSGTGEVTWVPDRVTTGELKAGDQVLPIAVVDAASDPSDQPDSIDGPLGDNNGN